MNTLTQRVRHGFADAFGGEAALHCRAPGRVNLIGEHTDYNDGFVLPAAIGVETQVALRPRAGDRVEVMALDFGGERDVFSLAETIVHAPEGGWRDYVRGTIAALIANGHRLSGAELVIGGDMPRGAGLSSSAALEVAVAGAMTRAAGLALPSAALARVAQAAECEFVGLRCGIMDQLASAASVAGAALLIDCRSLALRPIAIPSRTAVMIVHSGVVRGLVDGHYNRRRAECEAAAAALAIASLRDADEAMLEAARARLPETVFRRARHVVTENARTLAAADLLAGGDLAGVGRLMEESHRSMRDDFEITVPAIDRLADLLGAAIGDEGGARMTGGGFGGAVVALLRVEAAPRVMEAVRAEYRTPDGSMPEIMVEQPSGGFGLVDETALL